MKIGKILNNNAVIIYEEKNKEVILMGKGIAYGKKNGDIIDESKVTKIFDLGIKESQKKLVNHLIDIPIEYIELSDVIIEKVKKELSVAIDDSLYLNLTDHIHTSIERYKEGIILKNQMLFEIKHLYPKEFELGIWTITLIEKKYGIKMDESEAAFIAMHIITSEMGNEFNQVYEISLFIREVVEIVSQYFGVNFDEDLFDYYRFITHLKYFGIRVFNENHSKYHSSKNELLAIMKQKYTESYLCALKVAGFLEKKYDYFLVDDEILYLMIHIEKIISNSKGG